MTPYALSLVDQARYQVATEGGIDTALGARLLAEGIDPDALEDRLMTDFENSIYEEQDDGA